MANTTFTDYQTQIVADWLNEINDHVWEDAPVAGSTVHAAERISFTPAEGLTAEQVQAAIEELAASTTTRLAAKASMLDLATGLATKADNTTVTAGLAAKANAADAALTGQLSLNGSAGTSGQVPVSAGPGNPVVWGSSLPSAGGVGSLVFALNFTAGTLQYGDTCDGSTIQPANENNAVGSYGAMTGTWKCLGYSAVGRSTLFQRIS